MKPSPMKGYLITGTTRGLGEALAAQLIHKEHYLVSISRSGNPTLAAQAKAAGAPFEELTIDLAETRQLDSLMEQLFLRLSFQPLESLYLINNAGVLQPIAPAARSGSTEVEANIAINLVAPMLLTSAFIRLGDALPMDKRVLHISSGAGRKPYAGWSSYCAAKAGLDHYTRCVGLEEQGKAYGVKIASLAPGVIDTDMQAQIRTSRAEDFPQLSRFLELKASAQLSSPSQAAEAILRFLHSDKLGFGTIADVRELE